MRQITYRAPRSVILSGEYGGLYGKPVLACAINPPVTVSVSRGKSTRLSPFAKNVFASLKKKGIILPDDLMITEQDASEEIDDFYSKSSWSAAAVAACIHYATGSPPSPELVRKLTRSITKESSHDRFGVGVAAAVWGGLIYFRREFEFLPYLSILTFKIPLSIEKDLYLIPVARYQKDYAAHLGRQINAQPRKTWILLNDIERTTKKMVLALVKEDPTFFAAVVRENVLLLHKLGLVSPAAKRILEELGKAGWGKPVGEAASHLLVGAKPDDIKRLSRVFKLKPVKLSQATHGVHALSN